MNYKLELSIAFSYPVLSPAFILSLLYYPSQLLDFPLLCNNPSGLAEGHLVGDNLSILFVLYMPCHFQILK